MTALAAAFGALAGLGVFLVVMGVRGTEPDVATERAAFTRIRADHLLTRLLLGLGMAITAAVLTRWPVAVVAAAAAGAVLPAVRRNRHSRSAALARSEAVAGWIEMVRDTMAAAAGLNEAIIASARVAPEAIRDEVTALSVRSEHQPLSLALRRFASDLDDPVADAVVAALVLSNELQARHLGDVLGQIATNAREQVAMRQRIEASRARTYASAKFIVIVTMVFSVGLVLLAPTYLEPFNSIEGQLTLATVVGMFAAAWWGLYRLGQPATVARLLSDEASR